MGKELPLINFSLFEFTRRVFKGGGISLKGVFMLPVYYIQMVAGLPFAFLQFLFFSSRIKQTIISKDPIFILGHYRSGTTYLQKLMISDKQFGFLTNFDALFPNTNLLFGKKMQHVFQVLINKFKIKNPFFHNSTVLLSEPAEEDDYLMNKASAYSAYWGLVFPKRWRDWLNGSSQFSNQKYVDGWKREYLNTIQYSTFKNTGKQLVLKSPPNTERISLLLEMFPHAKFIFICRNPFHLFYSTKNMWEKAILNYYSVQKITETELDEIVFEHFNYLNGLYEKDKKLIPTANLVEISYEELKTAPFKTIQKIYSELKLTGFDLMANDLLSKIDLEKQYTTFQHQFTTDAIKQIEKRWGKYIQQWNYKSM